MDGLRRVTAGAGDIHEGLSMRGENSKTTGKW
jgi:hypothetical protein